MSVAARVVMVALTGLLGVIGCKSVGPGGDGSGADLLADDLAMRDMAGEPGRGILCEGLACRADEFCIHASSGAGPGPSQARCQRVPECDLTPTCDCFSAAMDDCHGWSPGGICWIEPGGMVHCQSQ